MGFSSKLKSGLSPPKITQIANAMRSKVGCQVYEEGLKTPRITSMLVVRKMVSHVAKSQLVLHYEHSAKDKLNYDIDSHDMLYVPLRRPAFGIISSDRGLRSCHVPPSLLWSNK